MSVRKQPDGSARGQSNVVGRSGQDGLSMNPIPVMQSSGSSSRLNVPTMDYGSAAGNLEDAKLAVEAFKQLVTDAVFLDEDAYAQATEVSRYQHRLYVQQRRIKEMELQMAAIQAEVMAKDEALAAAGARNQELLQKVAELQQELDNNSVVFKMHYSELLAKSEEISVLKGTLARLQQQQGQQGPAEHNLVQPGPQAAAQHSDVRMRDHSHTEHHESGRVVDPDDFSPWEPVG